MPESVIFLCLLVFVMAVLFITEKVSVDVVAITGLMLITLSGLVSPEEAFSGFSSPAIVTMISMFFVAGALRRTGVASFAARTICKHIGKKESVVISAVMLLGASLSAVMNNVAATTVLLPAVIAIGQETKVAASRLLMPLSFGIILGGMTTSIGTTPNILIIDLMADVGVEPFSFLDFFPYGSLSVVAAVIFVGTIGRFLLPDRKLGRRFKSSTSDLASVYRLSERLFSLKVPKTSLLAGQSLEQSQFATLFGAQVVAIQRGTERRLSPTSEDLIYPEDSLIVQGRRSRVEAMLKFQGVKVETFDSTLFEHRGELPDAALVYFDSDEFIGKDLRHIHFRERYGLAVVGIERNNQFISTNLGSKQIERDDVLHVVGPASFMDKFIEETKFRVEKADFYKVLQENLFVVSLPEDSQLEGMSIKESRLGELVGIQVLAISRDGKLLPDVTAEAQLAGSDELLVVGDVKQVGRLGMIGRLEVLTEPSLAPEASKDMLLAELVLPPRSKAIGKNLVEVSFRERFDFQVLAIWHEGRPYRSDLATRVLKFGDALLVYGPRKTLPLLDEDPDFFLLGNDDGSSKKIMHSIFAVIALFTVSILGITGSFPLHVAAVAGALIVLLSGAIRIEDAYSEVSWRIVFLVAALIPFGTALKTSGTAELLGDVISVNIGDLGFPLAVIILTLITSGLSQILDGAVAVVLIVPFAVEISERLNGDPRLTLMAITLASSVAFLTPFSHKASLLVMGAGGYKVKDYFRLGLPVTILTFCVIWLTLFLQ